MSNIGAPLFNMGYGNGQTLHRSSNAMEVSKFVIFEMPEFDSQYRRPYEASMPGEVMQAICDSIDPEQGIKAPSLAGVANRFLKPQAQPETARPIDVPNGWNIRRCRFLLEVIRPTPLGRTITVVMGYTEHSDYSYTGRLDDRMVFYVNSVASIREATHNTPMGAHTYRNVHDNYQVIVNNNWSGVGGEQEYSIRPQDVMSMISRQNLNVLPDWNMRAVDVRNAVRQVPMMSNRANNSATHYAASILDSYQTARDLSHLGSAQSDILSQARGNVAESSSAMNDFLMAIANVRGETLASNYFTMRELRMIDPDVERKHVFRRLADLVAVRAPTIDGQLWATHGQTVGWGGSDLFTQFAAIIVQSIPAIMVELGILGYCFVGTNRTFNGHSACATVDYNTFSNFDMSKQLAMLENRIATEILRDVSFMDTMDYEIRAHIDLLGETNMYISINGSEPAPFRCPSFCDALFTPIVTGNFNQAENVAGAFSTLFNTVLSDEPDNTPQLPAFVGRI